MTIDARRYGAGHSLQFIPMKVLSMVKRRNWTFLASWSDMGGGELGQGSELAGLRKSRLLA